MLSAPEGRPGTEGSGSEISRMEEGEGRRAEMRGRFAGVERKVIWIPAAESFRESWRKGQMCPKASHGNISMWRGSVVVSLLLAIWRRKEREIGVLTWGHLHAYIALKTY